MVDEMLSLYINVKVLEDFFLSFFIRRQIFGNYILDSILKINKKKEPV